MGFGLAIAYYNQKENLPLLAWGIEQNAEHIDHIVLSADAILEDGELSSFAQKIEDLDLPLNIIHQKHQGNGVNRCLNRAIDILRPEIVTVMAADTILPPGCLAELSLYTERLPKEALLSGPADDVKPMTLTELSEGKITRREDLTHTRFGGDNPFFAFRPWLWTRGVNLTFHREAFQNVRYDEKFDGRGYKDWDFVLRWAKTYGSGAVLVQPRSRRWHLNDWEGPSKGPNSELAGIRFADRLGEYFNHRYQLFGRRYCDPLCVNVGPLRGHLCDVNLDSQLPSWIRPGTANYISTDLSLVTDPEAHLRILESRLAPGGYIFAYNDEGHWAHDFDRLDAEPSAAPKTMLYLKEENE